jgi:hypothetical protein
MFFILFLHSFVEVTPYSFAGIKVGINMNDYAQISFNTFRFNGNFAHFLF